MLSYPHMDPVFLRIGPLQFRWYGLMYILAFLSGYFVLLSGVRKKGLPLDNEKVADLVFTVAVGVILGGRLGYILFYNLGFYLEHPLKLFAVWEGGMSFHGGLTGAVVASIYFLRKHKLRFYQMADIGFMAAPIGLCLGRLGNFINGELYGRVTDAPWGMVFPGGGDLPRHPSQLYEAFLEGPLMFLILYLVGKKSEGRDGVVFWTFIACYGLFRFIVEFFREPDVQIGYLLGIFSMGQLLSFPMFLAGLAMAVRCYRRR
ncbi:prolipoprotein diacylglyceryl transferase [Geomonas sp. Red276]